MNCFKKKGSIIFVSFQIKDYSGHFEIVSLVGTVSAGAHLHGTFSDDDGNVFGGHIVGDMYVHTTAEIILGECQGAVFTREYDEKSGYRELVIRSECY